MTDGKRGRVQIGVPRDRDPSFGPRQIRKGQTRFDGIEGRLISPRAGGMKPLLIRDHREEI